MDGGVGRPFIPESPDPSSRRENFAIDQDKLLKRIQGSWVSAKISRKDQFFIQFRQANSG